MQDQVDDQSPAEETVDLGTDSPVEVAVEDSVAVETIEMDIDLSANEPADEYPVAESAEDNQEPAPQVPKDLVNIIDDEDAAEIMENFSAEQEDAERLLVAQLVENMNVTMNDAPTTKVKEGTPVDMYLMTLPADIADIERLIVKYDIDFSDKVDISKLPEHVVRLRSAIMQTAGAYQSKHYEKIFTREGSDWGQGLKVDNALLRQALVSAKDNSANPVASILTQLGMGNVIQIPLWHSGIWVAIKRPSEIDLINLESEIAFEKATLGRGTNGAIFSNSEVYAKKAIVDFALRHVVKATTESIEPSYLEQLILETDWPLLAWGLVLASYPKGYRHLQPCVATPETCTHVIDTMLNISRLLWVDRSRFTPSQVAHMKSRQAQHSIEKIKAYQDEHKLKANSTIRINDVLELELRVPTIGRSISAGLEWVESINETARKVFNTRMSEAAREMHKQNHATLASIRQYVQWFGSFRRLDKDMTFTNENMVQEILAGINEAGDFSKLIHKRIKEYIDDITLATIAIPKWSCPACGKEPSEEYLRHPQLIPLDIIDVFFILLGQKIQKRLAEESSNVM